MASGKLFRTAIADDSSTAKEQLGSLRREYDTTNGFRVFRYVQASLTAAAANGTALAWYDTDASCVVTDDISTTDHTLPAGVAVGTLTNGNYGWVQVGGYHSAVKTDGGDDIAKGDLLIVDMATDGVCDSMDVKDTGSTPILGVAIAADVDASNTVAAILRCTYGDIVQ